MGVTTSNLIMGPARLFVAAFGATEPSDTSVSNSLENTSASASWTDVGGTSGGVTLVLNQTYTELTVDQLTQRPESRRTQIESMINTSFAEPTLENLAIILNDGTAASGSGFKSFVPDEDDSSSQPTYRAYCLQGFGPGGLRRWVFVRKALNTANIESAYSKDGQTLYPASLMAHYVSPSVKAYKIVDQTA